MQSGEAPDTLCSRCGAVLPARNRARRGEGVCPECGLGYRWATISTPTTSVRGRLARLRHWRQLRVDPAERRQVIRNCRFTLYGLDGAWTGRRWTGGFASEGEVVTEVELAHGDPWKPGEPVVRVTTHQPAEEPTSSWFIRDTACSLSEELWREGAEHDQVRATFVDADPLRSWTPVELPVSGRPVDFRRLQGPLGWAAIGHVGDQLVTVVAHHIPPERVKLAAADPQAYLADDGRPREPPGPAAD